MRREAYFRELERLLRDIPEEERRDALDYYQGYLDEAGPDKEEQALRELGTPWELAEQIRLSARGETGAGVFTEQGYSEKTAVSQPPEVFDREGKEGQQEKRENQRENQKGQGKAGRKLLLILGIVCLSPFILALCSLAVAGAGVAAGGLLSVILTLAGIFLLAGALAGSLLIGGAAALFLSVAAFMSGPWAGLAVLGAGLLLLGLGCVCLSLAILFYGVFLPWLFSTLFRAVTGRRGRREEER